MDEPLTIDEYIETMVRVHYGHTDVRTQQIYRQSLQVLVEMAKSKGREELEIDLYCDPKGTRRVLH